MLLDQLIRDRPAWIAEMRDKGEYSVFLEKNINYWIETEGIKGSRPIISAVSTELADWVNKYHREYLSNWQVSGSYRYWFKVWENYRILTWEKFLAILENYERTPELVPVIVRENISPAPNILRQPDITIEIKDNTSTAIPDFIGSNIVTSISDQSKAELQKNPFSIVVPIIILIVVALLLRGVK